MVYWNRSLQVPFCAFRVPELGDQEGDAEHFRSGGSGSYPGDPVQERGPEEPCQISIKYNSGTWSRNRILQAHDHRLATAEARCYIQAS